MTAKIKMAMRKSSGLGRRTRAGMMKLASQKNHCSASSKVNRERRVSAGYFLIVGFVISIFLSLIL